MISKLSPRVSTVQITLALWQLLNSATLEQKQLQTTHKLTGKAVCQECFLCKNKEGFEFSPWAIVKEFLA